MTGSIPWKSEAWIDHTQTMLNSFRHFVGRELIDRTASPEQQAEFLFYAPFVVVSHGTEADPILNYGNQAALDLWQFELE
ncbi:MAG: MEKHLA domain-containing protein, partial [Planctomycetaceae bacterium]|nr:MEKHLA domain-containing protein [Planctomycetaceae bacterium]